MGTLQVVYDSRLSSKKDLFKYLRDYSHTVITVMQVDEWEVTRCMCCNVNIPVNCYYALATISKRSDPATHLLYCKDCSAKTVTLASFTEIDWSLFACRGECSALHATWSMMYPHLSGKQKQYS